MTDERSFDEARRLMAEPLTAMELDALRIAAVDRNFVGYGPRSAQVAVLRLVATLDRLATPIRFDLDDRSTWPELGMDVLTFGINGGGGFVVSHLDKFDGEFWWLHESPERVAEATVTAWWPLPPTPGGEQ